VPRPLRSTRGPDEVPLVACDVEKYGDVAVGFGARRGEELDPILDTPADGSTPDNSGFVAASATSATSAAAVTEKRLFIS
jgi:hypothetical protein